MTGDRWNLQESETKPPYTSSWVDVKSGRDCSVLLHAHDGLPEFPAVLTPDQSRQVAKALVEIADHVEAQNKIEASP